MTDGKTAQRSKGGEKVQTAANVFSLDMKCTKKPFQHNNKKLTCVVPWSWIPYPVAGTHMCEADDR